MRFWEGVKKKFGYLKVYFEKGKICCKYGKWEKDNGLREIDFLRSCYCCESLGTRVNEMN